MRLTTFMLIAVITQVSASSFAQKITLSEKGAPLRRVFDQIRLQSGYDFLFTTTILKNAKPVSIEAKDAKLEEVLKEIFKDQSLEYVINDKRVVIKEKRPSFLDRVLAAVAPVDIRGKVIGEGDQVLAGAIIRLKGTERVIRTNEKGEFYFPDVDEKSILMISYLGYEPKEVGVEKSMYLTIRLVSASQSLEQVAIVSTGYQNLKKTQLTGAYSTINRDTYLQTVPANGNIIDNMEGRIPGLVLNLNQSGSNWQEPGNASPFTIRGVSTFNAIKKPLIVLNGYPTEIDIASINPYDIESITVLKDAASAAIYGVRASNGVVVIVTRKGKNGKPVFQLNTSLSFRPKPDYYKLNLLTGSGFVDYERAMGLNDIENNDRTKAYLDASNGTYTPVFSITDDLYHHRITQEEADRKFNEPAAYDNTEDYKKLFLQNQLYQSYDFNVSGGSNSSTYLFGVNHQDNRGSGKFSGYRKTNINYKGSFEFSKRISMDVQTIYSNINDQRVPIPEYLSLKPYQRFLAENGDPLPTYFSPSSFDYFGFGDSYGTISAAQNQRNMAVGLYDQRYYPYQEMFENSTETKSNVYRVQGNLKARIVDGLNLELGGVFERQVDQLNHIASENAYTTRIRLNYYASPDRVSGNPVFGIPQGGIKRSTDSRINTYTLRAQLTYNKMLTEKHDLSFLAGAEQRKITSSGSSHTVFGYDEQTLTVKQANLSLLGSQTFRPGYANVIVPLSGYGVYDQTEFGTLFQENYADNRFLSYYANAAYTYNSRYTITGSLRIDQSNLFGTDPKFRYTPLWSGGISWNISKENFLKDSKYINELKLRLAAGYNGNIIKNSGPYNILGSFVNGYLKNPTVGYAIKVPRNNQLRWEKTFNVNTGLDFSVLNNRISGSVDYYIKRGEDIFSPVQSDPTFGFSNLYTNNASIENRGIDLMLSTLNVKTAKFSWQTQLTGSFNRSKVLALRNKWGGHLMFVRAGGAENIEGHPMNSVLTFDYAGLNDQGQPMIRDEKGNLVLVGYGQPDIAFEALKFAGVNDPKYAIGFNNQLSAGSFSLSVLLMYYGGHVGLVAPPTVLDLRPTREMANFWRKAGDEKTTEIPGFTDPTAYMYGQKFVRKFDYIALRDVTLTYNVNNAVSRKLGLSNTRLIFQVQNPGKYVFSGNDIDPETFSFNGGTRGLPIVPTYTFSLSTSF